MPNGSGCGRSRVTAATLEDVKPSATRSSVVATSQAFWLHAECARPDRVASYRRDIALMGSVRPCRRAALVAHSMRAMPTLWTSYDMTPVVGRGHGCVLSAIAGAWGSTASATALPY